MLARLKGWAGALLRDVVSLWIAAGSNRTPLPAKIVAALVAAYALSPIDLIPDAIPVLGLLDDLLLVPLGTALAIRLIPSPLMARFRHIAERRRKRPRSRLGLWLVLATWVALLVGAALVLR